MPALISLCGRLTHKLLSQVFMLPKLSGGYRLPTVVRVFAKLLNNAPLLLGIVQRLPRGILSIFRQWQALPLFKA